MTKEPGNIQNIYFLGIGGIGMSALARYFKLAGKKVAGYDRTPTPLTAKLNSEGIALHYDDAVENIPQEFTDRNNTLVVYTPAIPHDHLEFNYFINNHFTLYKRSQILGEITKQYTTIAVAGTHGKTTVSTMIAHIMAGTAGGCNAFLGGISKNFNSNLVLNSESKYAVTEADEFDRSFLQLFPYAAVVTSMDPDHLDIYGNFDSLRESFNKFISQVSRDGILLVKEGIKADSSVFPQRTFTYSLNGKTNFSAQNIRLSGKKYHFDLYGPDIRIKDISLVHPGLVNVENAVAASSVCALLGTDHDHIRASLEGFTGIQRRFDYRINTPAMVYIDDYAHHPKEIEATLTSVRELYPGKKITGVFQPHLYTRTRDLAEGFAESLNLLDRLILLDIYPAREEPIAGVTSDMIFEKVSVQDKIRCSKDQLMQLLEQTGTEILITLGAGDIDKFVEPITQLFSHSAKQK